MRGRIGKTLINHRFLRKLLLSLLMIYFVAVGAGSMSLPVTASEPGQAGVDNISDPDGSTSNADGSTSNADGSTSDSGVASEQAEKPALKTAKPVTGLRQKQWWYYKRELVVVWDRQTDADGFEYVCRKKDGSLHAEGTVDGTSKSVTIEGVVKKMIYTFKVRSFVINDGQKCYSEWSPVIICFSQPRVSLVKVKGGSLHVKWRKVSGATGYAVYISGRKRSGYRRVITVSGKKRAVTIKKFRGNKFNAGRKYYVYVVALRKANGLMNTSGALYYWNSKNRNVGYLG